ncbi:HNH endonuclease signature motif containing protein [Marinisporobacter balticus]|uniref:HNH/ENDO VII superfamily nuclease n=1 Tax=Marinisporobacter balticus TaxID=2018667 RepID=A0A4V2S9S3_9FIRM|nr:HNH endonuclease [Marinisporobacter balticus]TCO68980.1 HNH/ENDO VII superfamily nuclease [Marinisporobacter balticus]
MLDFLLQARKAVIEEYPILNFPSNVLKNVVSGVRNGIVDGGQGVGSLIYELDIPGVSDFVGEFTKVREEGAEINRFSVVGSFANGVLVKGVGQTVEGVANLVADPLAAVEGINKIFAYPEETLPAICSGVSEFVDKKIIHGTPEDRAEAAGQAVFEVAAWFVGAGEAKAGLTAAKAADKAGDAAKVIKTVENLEDVAKTAKTIQIAGKSADLSQTAKILGKSLAKGLDEKALKLCKNVGNTVDNMRTAMNHVTDNIMKNPKLKPALADGNINLIDNASDTAKRIKTIEKTEVQKNFNKVMEEYKNGSGVNIKKKVDAEDVGKLADDSKALDSIEGTGKTTAGVSKAKSFMDDMSPAEAARYKDYWHNVYSENYGNVVNSNKPWTWRDMPGGDKLTAADKVTIKSRAVERGVIPHVKMKQGTRYADFEGAGVVQRVESLPEHLWKASDSRQFNYLDELIGGRPQGTTWNHSEISGRMELVPFGIHNVTNHMGGRSPGHWAHAKR